MSQNDKFKFSFFSSALCFIVERDLWYDNDRGNSDVKGMGRGRRLETASFPDIMKVCVLSYLWISFNSCIYHGQYKRNTKEHSWRDQNQKFTSESFIWSFFNVFNSPANLQGTEVG